MTNLGIAKTTMFETFDHPFFGCQDIGDKKEVFCLRPNNYGTLHPNPSANSTLFSIMKQPVHGQFDTIEEAEEYLFSKITPIVRDKINLDDKKSNVFKAVRSGNMIARRTRRGFGNYILIHPDDIGLFHLDNVIQLSVEERIGHWQKYGMLDNRMAIWTADLPWIERETFIVGYRGASSVSGNMDAGAFIAKTKTGYSVALNAVAPPISYNDYFGKVARA